MIYHQLSEILLLEPCVDGIYDLIKPDFNEITLKSLAECTDSSLYNHPAMWDFKKIKENGVFDVQKKYSLKHLERLKPESIFWFLEKVEHWIDMDTFPTLIQEHFEKEDMLWISSKIGVLRALYVTPSIFTANLLINYDTRRYMTRKIVAEAAEQSYKFDPSMHLLHDPKFELPF